MIALDLFCGAGGASKGLLNAGFKRVVGIDKVAQPEYFDPDNLKIFDAIAFLKDIDMSSFDFVWASPPCQAYSCGTLGVRNKGKKYPALIPIVRKLLLKTGKPFVIENVPGAPLRKDLILCGEMFGLKVIRHRYFEINNFECEQPKHQAHKGKVWNGTAIGVWTGGKPGCFGNEEHRKYYYTVVGHSAGTLKAWQKAMQIDWVKDKHTLAQCVPPAYAEYIGKQFLKAAI